MLIRSIKYVWTPVNTRAEMGVHRVQQLKFIKRLGEHHLWKSDLSSWRVIEAQVIRVSECRMLKVYSAEHHTRVLFVVEFSRVTADSFCVKTDCDLDRTQTKCCQFNASHSRYSRTISMLITSSHVWIKLKNNPVILLNHLGFKLWWRSTTNSLGHSFIFNLQMSSTNPNCRWSTAHAWSDSVEYD